MITPEEARLRAEQNFLSGLNCTQSVVEVFAEYLGFDAKKIMSLSLPFGAGTCRLRESCGTFSALMICLGMAMGVPDGDKQRKDEIYAQGQELSRIFTERNGSIICRDLLGLSKNIKNVSPVSEERTPEYYKKRPCPKLCGVAAEIFAEWLIKQESSR